MTREELAVLVIAGHGHERDHRDQILGADEEAGLAVGIAGAPVVGVLAVELDVAALEDDVGAGGEDVARDHLVHRAARAAVAVEDHVERRARGGAGAEVERAVDGVARERVLVLGRLGQPRQGRLVIAVARGVGAAVRGRRGHRRGRALHAIGHGRAVGVAGGAPVHDHLVGRAAARDDRAVVNGRRGLRERGDQPQGRDRDSDELRSHPAPLQQRVCLGKCRGHLAGDNRQVRESGLIVGKSR